MTLIALQTAEEVKAAADLTAEMSEKAFTRLGELAAQPSTPYVFIASFICGIAANYGQTG